MMDWKLWFAMYLEINILLGLVWILWILTKKTMKVLRAESTQQRQLLLARFLFLFLLISPVLARGLPSAAWDALGAQWESIGPIQQIQISQSFLPFDFLDPITTAPSLLVQQAKQDSLLSDFTIFIQQITGQTWLFFVFGIGLLIKTARRIREIGRLHRIIRNGFLWKKIGKLQLILSEDISVPFSTKVFGKSQIVLPVTLLTSPEYLRIAIAHEGQHHRHRDPLWEVFMASIQLLCYWNPTVYLWKMEFEHLQEFACDEALLKQQQITPYAYGSCLLDAAESVFKSPLVLVGTTRMGMRTFFQRNLSSQLKRRIQMLETSKPIHQSRWKTGIQGGILMLGTLLFSMVALGCASVISEEDNGLPPSETSSQERIAKNGSQGWLGVGIQDIDEELANAFKLESTEGVLITKTFRNNPARNAGIQRGDVVVGMNGKKLQNSEQLRNGVAAAGANTSVDLELIRKGETKTIQVALSERPQHFTRSWKRNRPRRDRASHGWLGVSIQDLDEESAKTLGRENTQGSLIAKVFDNTPAKEAGIQNGDLVVEMNGKTVENSRQFRHDIIAAGADTLVNLELIRKGEARNLQVKLGKRSWHRRKRP